MLDPSQLVFISKFKLSKESRQFIRVNVSFPSDGDLRQIQVRIKKAGDWTEKQETARDVLRNYLQEVAYHRKQKSLAMSAAEITHLQSRKLSEIGVPLVYKYKNEVTAAVFFHLTWKENVFLDWMAILPQFQDPEKSIEKLGYYVLAGVMFTARGLNSKWLFLESKQGAAARFYKKVFRLKEERDFILLVRALPPNRRGWRVRA